MRNILIIILIFVCSPCFAQANFGGDEAERTFDVRHVDLTDMPNALNTDHDGRYIKFYRDVPASASSTGQHPAMAFDGNYIYGTIATDTWQRVAWATWSPTPVSGLLEIEGTTSLILIEGSSTSGISLE